MTSFHQVDYHKQPQNGWLIFLAQTYLIANILCRPTFNTHKLIIFSHFIVVIVDHNGTDATTDGQA